MAHVQMIRNAKVENPTKHCHYVRNDTHFESVIGHCKVEQEVSGVIFGFLNKLWKKKKKSYQNKKANMSHNFHLAIVRFKSYTFLI